MKKLISLVMSIAMIFCVGTAPAFAVEMNDNPSIKISANCSDDIACLAAQHLQMMKEQLGDSCTAIGFAPDVFYNMTASTPFTVYTFDEEGRIITDDVYMSPLVYADKVVGTIGIYYDSEASEYHYSLGTTYATELNKLFYSTDLDADSGLVIGRLGDKLFATDGANANILFEEVTSVDFSDAFQTITTNKNTYTAKTVIVATGVKRRELNCEGEKEFAGKGVSYCATCDGAFFRNKNVVVVGGGNTALEDALFLSNQCQSVTLIHRRDTFRAEKHLVDAVLSRDNITILYDSNVKSINGNHVVNAIDVYHTKQNQITTIETDGIFIAIGYEPDNEMVSHYLNVNTEGYIVSNEYCHTNIEGVFVAGDTRTKPLRQIITACADGAVAGVSAVSYISTHFK